MKLLVTGASGFLGRHVVEEALRRGHAVRALVRPGTEAGRLPWARAPGVELARADLRAHEGLAACVGGVDAVVHLAAVTTGDLHAQLAGTVVGTENLLAAMAEAGVARLVAVSSLAVYDYQALPRGAVLDETAPLERRFEARDAYARAKGIQEELIRERAARHGWRLTVLRPGVIYGRDRLWTARLGIAIGDLFWLRVGGGALLPLTYVENCAEAVVRCAEALEHVAGTFNVVDDDLPTQRKYAARIRRLLSPAPWSVVVPWIAAQALARTASLANRWMFRGRLRLPGLLLPASAAARHKPLRYGNVRLKEALGWYPRYGLAEALARSTGEQMREAPVLEVQGVGERQTAA